MHAVTQFGLDQGTEAGVTLKNGAFVRAGSLNILADLDADLFTKTTAGGGGGIAAVGAASKVFDDSSAVVSIEDGADLGAAAVTISARANREADGAANSATFALASGSGASLELDALGDAKVMFVDKPGDADARTTVNGSFVQIDSFNRVLKEATLERDGVAPKVGDNTSSGSANLIGVAGIGTDADIGQSDNKSEAVVDLGNTKIVGQGSYDSPSRIILRAITDHSVADSSDITAVSLIGGKGVALTTQEIHAATDIKMDGAHIDNLSGQVFVETRANMRNTADAAIFQSGTLASGILGIDVTSRTNNDTTIDLDNTRIDGKRIEISAGKANNLVSSTVARTAANGSIASIAPSIGVAVQTNSVDRNATVDIDGGSILRSAGNLLVSAEKGLFQNSYDGMVLVLAVPPYGYNVTNEGGNTGAATVNVASNAKLRAGVNYQTYFEVAYGKVAEELTQLLTDLSCSAFRLIGAS
jgi:hypothetical protein